MNCKFLAYFGACRAETTARHALNLVWVFRTSPKPMAPEFWFGLIAFVLLAAVTTISQGRQSKVIDWDIYMAFVRHDFPPEQRDTAQGLAGSSEDSSGRQSRSFGPEYTLREIAKVG